MLTLTPCDQWEPEITNDLKLRDRAHFKPFTLGGMNNHNDNDNPKYWTLDSLNGAHVILSSLHVSAADRTSLRAYIHRHPQDRHRGWGI
jgi:hypothetical protein